MKILSQTWEIVRSSLVSTWSSWFFYFVRITSDRERVEWRSRGQADERGMAVKTLWKLLSRFVCFKVIRKNYWKSSSLSSLPLYSWHSVWELFLFRRVSPTCLGSSREPAPTIAGRTWLQHHFRFNEWVLNGRRLVYDLSFSD